MMPASIDENGLREAPTDAPPPEESSKRRPGEGLVLHRVRQVGLVVATLLGTAYFLSVVHEHHPITEWLFWTFAEAWALALIWAAGCLSTATSRGPVK